MWEAQWKSGLVQGETGTAVLAVQGLWSQHHYLRAIECTAPSYKDSPIYYIEGLRKQREDAEMGYKREISKLIRLKLKKKNWRNELYSEFEEFKSCLRKE